MLLVLLIGAIIFGIFVFAVYILGSLVCVMIMKVRGVPKAAKKKQETGSGMLYKIPKK